jgi:hypothetical protein
MTEIITFNGPILAEIKYFFKVSNLILFKNIIFKLNAKLKNVTIHESSRWRTKSVKQLDEWIVDE